MSSLAPLVFVGGMTLDVIAEVPHYPGADERVIANVITQSGGGPAATAAVTAARLGAEGVCFVGAVGEDSVGEMLMSELTAEGVDVSAVVRVPGARSGSSVVIVDGEAGTRAICTQPGPALALSGNAAALIGAARWVHVDHLGWSPIMTLRGAAPTRGRPRLSVDISYPVTGFDITAVDLFAPNLEFLATRYGNGVIPASDQARQALLTATVADGARMVVATRGGHGSIAATADGDRYTVPGMKVPVVSTLGAGDVFHGALLTAVDRGDPLPSAMAYANTVAALSCRGLDGRSAIPDHTQTMAALAAVSV